MEGDSLSPVRLRQIALVAKDLPRARHELTSILGVPVIYEDPAVGQWGLQNILIPLGGDIIEVVSPTRPNTTAGRLLDKRGDGGYMLIMQTEDADARRREIEAAGTAKVIFSHPFSHSYSSWEGVRDEGFCIQYHPKAVRGGMMPELDSHTLCGRNSRPLQERFSPWHACGADYDRYVRDMRATSHLRLQGCLLQLGGRDVSAADAARQWSDAFGVPVSNGELDFTNARVGFSQDGDGLFEGLLYITVAVEHSDQMHAIFDRARAAGKVVHSPGDWFEMTGVRWAFTLLEGQLVSSSGRVSRL